MLFMLGILSESNLLPIEEAAFRTAIIESGIAVDSNLAGFEAGINFVHEGFDVSLEMSDAGDMEVSAQTRAQVESFGFPTQVTRPVTIAYEKLVDFQDQSYANEYLEMIAKFFAADCDAGGKDRGFALTSTMAKCLARTMCYNDIIQVARSKCRVGRHQRIRTEVGCKPSSLLQVTDFLKPGRGEVASMLPPGLSRMFLARFPSEASESGTGRGMRIGSHTILGFGMMRLLASLRFWRKKTARFSEEKELRARWCATVIELADRDYDAAMKVANSSDLLRGYGEAEKIGRSKIHFNSSSCRRACFDESER